MKRVLAATLFLMGTMAIASSSMAQKDGAADKSDLSKPPELADGPRGVNGNEGPSDSGRPPRPTREQHEALKACAKKSGITLPDPGPDGPPPRPSEAERKVMDACMDSIGMKHPSGPRPEARQ